MSWMLNKRKCWNVKCDDSSGKESKLQRNVRKRATKTTTLKELEWGKKKIILKNPPRKKSVYNWRIE